MCIKSVAPFLSQFVTANGYVQYICTQVLPVLDRLITVMSACGVPTVESDILQTLAELVQSVHPSNTSKPIDVKQCHAALFQKLLQFLPSPPTEAGDSVVEPPAVHLRNTESLLFAFHQLGKHETTDLLNNDALVKDLKLRLQFLARGVQNETKKVREELDAAKKAKESMQSEENKERLIGLKSSNNIQAIIRDLFHTPPSFKASVSLSWKPATKPGAKVSVSDTTTKAKEAKSETENGAGAPKRKAVEAPAASVAKKEREVYAPPTGKFTSRGSYTFNPCEY